LLSNKESPILGHDRLAVALAQQTVADAAERGRVGVAVEKDYRSETCGEEGRWAIVFMENNLLPERELIQQHAYVPVKNSRARSSSAACCCLARRCRKWLRIEESRVERSVGGAKSRCAVDVSGLLTGDSAARLPSCSDQVLAACRAVSLSEFMAPAFADAESILPFL
jgi:hypothetical protein